MARDVVNFYITLGIGMACHLPRICIKICQITCHVTQVGLGLRKTDYSDV